MVVKVLNSESGIFCGKGCGTRVKGVEGLVYAICGAVDGEDDGISLLCGVLEGMFVRGGLVCRNLRSSAILFLHSCG